MVFGRRKRPAARTADQEAEHVAADQEPQRGVDHEALTNPADTEYERSKHGPFDLDEVGEDTEAFIDLGALRIALHERLQLRLEIEESTQRVIAVSLDLDSSSLQLQAFAAPRSQGLWAEIREQISQSVAAQGGSTEVLDGAFGPEILAKLPAQASDGATGYRVARFIGVDGPRWFLRGVLGGPAAVDRTAAAELERLFRATVVVRGQIPMPPRDLLTLRLPPEAVPGEQPVQEHAEQGQAGPNESLQMLRRGPEITEVR